MPKFSQATALDAAASRHDHPRTLLRRFTQEQLPARSRMPLLLFSRRAPGTGLDHRELVNLLDTALAIAADFGPLAADVAAAKLCDADRFPPPRHTKSGDNGSSSP